MKLNKTFGRVATTLVATAMLASLAAPAYAAEAPLTSNSTDSTVTIPVNLAVDATETTPAMDTTYTIGYLGDNAVMTAGDKKGVSGDILADGAAGSDLKVTIAANTAPDSVSGKVSDNLVLKFDTTAFNVAGRGPGIYEYTLTEGTVPTGVDADGPFLLRVWVINANEEAPDGKYEIAGAELFAKSGEGYSEDKQDSIEKVYTTYTLTLTKEIDGKFASKDTSFDFDVTFTSRDGYVGNFAYTYGGTQTGSTGGTVVFDTDTDNRNETVNVDLKHGATVTFTGIPADVTLGIVENADGYTADITSNDTDATITEASKTYAGDMKVEDADSNIDVKYVNTSDNDTNVATGIVMDVAPYALLVVAAAAGCFVFLRKRRED